MKAQRADEIKGKGTGRCKANDGPRDTPITRDGDMEFILGMAVAIRGFETK
jgi:hypothetical protein